MSEGLHRAWIPGTLALLVLVGLVFFLRAKLPVEEWVESRREDIGKHRRTVSCNR